MHSSSAALSFLGISVIYVVYSIAHRIYISFRNASKANSLHCLPPPSETYRLPLGIDQIQLSLASIKTKSFPNHIIRRQQEVGALTFGTKVLGRPGFFTVDEQNIQAMLATQFEDFELGPVRRANAHPFLGSGIFSQDGKEWARSRALIKPQFARDQISDLEIEEKHVLHLMTVLDEAENEEVDLQPLLFNLTLDAATEFLLGKSANSQMRLLELQRTGIEGDEEEDFGKAFDVGNTGLAIRARFAPYVWAIFPKGWMKANKICRQWVDRIVAAHLSERRADLSEKKTRPSDVEGRYVFLEALADHTQDPIELRSQILHLLLAGRDTTASLIGWTLFELVRDQARYQKLREIILRDFGEYSSCDTEKDISFTKIKACKYLQYCMNEVQRLNSIVPLNFRISNKDTTLPRGGGPDGKSKIFVPKGTSVQYSIHVLHRRKDIWGPDADKFVPERWEGRKFGWEYIPFNGGPRICLGQQYALIEASYVLIRLLQRYERMENRDTELQAKYHTTMTSCSGNGVKVKLCKA